MRRDRVRGENRLFCACGHTKTDLNLEPLGPECNAPFAALAVLAARAALATLAALAAFVPG